MNHTSIPRLEPRDLELFARFGVGPELLLDAGVRRVTDEEARECIPLSRPGDLSGLLFPYMDPETRQHVTCRIRRDHPEVEDGKVKRKYVSPYGDQKHLHLSAVSPLDLKDVAGTVVIVESEKSALMLRALSDRTGRRIAAIATGGCWGWRGRIGKAVSPTGARVDEVGPLPDLGRFSWKRDSPPLARDVVIVFDSNSATNAQVRRARRALAADLASRGARVRIGTVPVEPGVNGPDDYRAAHDDAALLKLLDDAVPVQPATVDELLEECGVLSLANPVDASQAEPVIRAVRDALRGADPLRTSAVRSKLVSLLKAGGLRDAGRVVDSAIGVMPEPAASDTPFLADVEPWPDPVDDGAAAVNDVVALLKKYIVLPKYGADAIALWCLHSFLMGVWNISPILAALSPVKRCAKSLLLEVVERLVPRGLLVSNLSTASLFRVVETFRPTLLSDEADTWLSDETSELRGVFNSGWRRGTAKVLRCEGDENEPKVFSTWAAKVIATIGKLPGTIEDRAIIIQLRRRMASEPIARFRHDRVEGEALPLRRQLRRWADDHAADLARLDPKDLDALNDRASDNWRALRSLALGLGQDWPERADAAALALSGAAADAADNIVVELLADIRAVFDDHDEDALPSATMVSALVGMADRPWGEWSRGKPLNAHRLARLLSPFGIMPVDRRVGAGGKVLKSYRRGAFEDAWQRYISPDPGLKAQHRNNVNEYGPGSTILKAQQSETCCALKSEKPSMNTGLCCDVAVQNPEKAPGSVLRLTLAEDWEDPDGRFKV